MQASRTGSALVAGTGAEPAEAVLARLDPQAAAVLEANLAAIDAALAETRQALQRDPADAYLQRHQAATEQARRDLIGRAARLAGERM
jgi:hypothetical protein